MSFNLMDAAKSLYTSELINKASAYLSESETGVSKAINGILPTIIGGLINKTSTSEGAATVFKMVSEQSNPDMLNNPESFFGAGNGNLINKGMGLLTGLFGHKVDGITRCIASFAGIRYSSASSLLSMALPVVLSLIGKHSNIAGATGVATLLSSQTENMIAAMPVGLNVNSMSGKEENKVSDINMAINSKQANDSLEKETDNSGLSILLTILILVGAAMAAWYLFGKDSNAEAVAATNTTDSAKATIPNTIAGRLDELTGDWIYNDGEMASMVLPNNGGQLTVGKNSTEYKLVNFLKNKNIPVDTVKGNWFEFTNVHFKTGGARLTDESMKQLKNIVTIAKAFPVARFKFGGYTDSTGTDAVNIPLSKKRADAVAVMVGLLGVPKQSIVGAEGYGSLWPIQPNDTKEGQAQNRRVSVRVKAK